MLDLFGCAQAETAGARGGAIFFLLGCGRLFGRFDRRGGMQERDGNHAAGTVWSGDRPRSLEETLAVARGWSESVDRVGRAARRRPGCARRSGAEANHPGPRIPE